MALTKRERRILRELEAGLRELSGRPRAPHIRAAIATLWWLAGPAVAALVAAPIVAGLLTDTLTVVLAGVAGLMAVVAGCLIWGDARNRAAGD